MKPTCPIGRSAIPSTAILLPIARYFSVLSPDATQPTAQLPRVCGRPGARDWSRYVGVGLTRRRELQRDRSSGAFSMTRQFSVSAVIESVTMGSRFTTNLAAIRMIPWARIHRSSLWFCGPGLDSQMCRYSRNCRSSRAKKGISGTM